MFLPEWDCSTLIETTSCTHSVSDSEIVRHTYCLLYTSDAADDLTRVDPVLEIDGDVLFFGKITPLCMPHYLSIAYTVGT